MRHRVRGRSLSRSPAHRKAVLANLAQELFQHKRIRTTLAKARELRPFAEKLVTTAKKGHIAARRHVLRFLSRKSVVKSLFDEIAPAFADRNGGYTRIIKLGSRVGDNAPLAMVELVGFEGVTAAAAAAETSKAAKKKGAKPAAAKEKGKAKPSKKAAAEPKGHVAGHRKALDSKSKGSSAKRKGGEK